jgi:hypothetical protein
MLIMLGGLILGFLGGCAWVLVRDQVKLRRVSSVASEIS